MKILYLEDYIPKEDDIDEYIYRGFNQQNTEWFIKKINENTLKKFIQVYENTIETKSFLRDLFEWADYDSSISFLTMYQNITKDILNANCKTKMKFKRIREKKETPLINFE